MRFGSYMVVLFSLLLGSSILDSAELCGYDTFRDVYSEWQTRLQELQRDNMQVDTAAKRQSLTTEFAERFAAVAIENHSSDDWVQSLIWFAQEGSPGGSLESVVKLLSQRAESIGNPGQLQLAMSVLISLDSQTLDDELRKIVESQADYGVRGAALYALAARMKIQSEALGGLEGCAKAREMLTETLDKYPNVNTYHGSNSETATKLLEDLDSDTAIGMESPTIIGVGVDGTSISIDPSLEDRLLLICFSGHWCGPCCLMHPVLNEIIADHAEDGLIVLEINTDPKENLDEVRAKIKEDSLNWLTISDGNGGSIATQWRVHAYPTYLLVDHSGAIRHRVVGANGPLLKKLISKYVGGE